MKNCLGVLILFSFISLPLSGQNFLDQLRKKYSRNYQLSEKNRINYYLNASGSSEFEYNLILKRGISNLQHGLYDSAELCFHKLLINSKEEEKITNTRSNQYAEFPEACFYLGLCKKSRGQTDSARHYFKRAIRADYLFTDAYIEMGVLMMTEGDHGKADYYLEKAMDLNPNSGNAHYYYGLLSYHNGRHTRALRYLKKAAKLEPGFEMPYVQIALMKLLDRNIYGAIRFCNKAIDVNPGSTQAYVLKGLCRIGELSLNSAYENFTLAYHTDTSNYRLLRLLGTLDIIMKRYEQGIEKTALSYDIINNEDNFRVINDYDELEFEELIMLLYENRVTDGERDLAYEVLPSLYGFKDIEDGWHTVKSFLEDHPNSTFARRIKLLLRYKEYGDTGFEYFEKLLQNAIKQNEALYTLQILKSRVEFEKGESDSSLMTLNKLTCIWPEYTYAYYMKGRNYLELEKPDQAILSFDSALRYYPEHDMSLAYRGVAKDKQKKYRSALKDYFKSYFLNPDNTWLATRIGNCYTNLGIYDSAFHYLKLHDELNAFTYNFDNYCHKAEYYRAIGDIDSARICLKKVFDWMPKYTVALEIQGEIYYEKGSYEKAAESFLGALNNDPSNKYCFSKLGDTYMNLGKYDTAIMVFEAAQQLDRNYNYPQIRLGDCYMKTNDFVKAMYWYKRAACISIQDKGLPLKIASCYNYCGKVDSAIRFIQLSMLKDTANYWKYELLAMISYLSDDFKKSIQYSEKAIELNPKMSVYAYFYNPLAKLRLNRIEEARKLYEEAIAQFNRMKREIPEIAVMDLEYLIEKDIMKDEASGIIAEFFN